VKLKKLAPNNRKTTSPSFIQTAGTGPKLLVSAIQTATANSPKNTSQTVGTTIFRNKVAFDDTLCMV
jgi:hypothetical protein